MGRSGRSSRSNRSSRSGRSNRSGRSRRSGRSNRSGRSSRSRRSGRLNRWVGVVWVWSVSLALHRSLVDTMRLAASRCPGFCRSLPLNRDDDARVEAIERELIKLGSQVGPSRWWHQCSVAVMSWWYFAPQTSMDIVQYCLVNWEELGPPQVGQSAGRLASGGAARIPSEMKSATLLYKTSNMLGLSVWKQGYFELR